MKVLIPIDNERIAPRFCSAKNFVIFEISNNGKIKNKGTIDVSLMGSFEKAKLVKDKKIDTVVCLGIEGWIYHYLTGFGIEVLPGVFGNLDHIINRLISGRLQFRPFPMYGFKLIQRGRYRRGMRGHKHFRNGHFKNRFM